MIKKVLIFKSVCLLYCLFAPNQVLASFKDVDSLKSLLNSEEFLNSDSCLYRIYSDISFYSTSPTEKWEYAQEAYKIAVKVKNIGRQAASKLLESNAYIKWRDLDKAIETILEAEILYRTCNNYKGVAACKHSLAKTYRSKYEIDLAEKAYLESISLFLEAQDSIGLAAIHLNLGEFYRGVGNKKDDALLHYREAYDIYNKLKYEYGVAYCNGNIGLLYVAQNKLDTAEVYLSTAIAYLKPQQDNYAVSSYLDGLAEIYLKKKLYGKAKSTARKSLMLAKEHRLNEQIRDANLRLSSICKNMGLFKDAYGYHKQYVAYRDSINNEGTIRQIASLHTKYKVAQKQKEVDEEKSQKELYLIISISLVVAIVLFCVIMVIMLKNSRERKKVTKVLEEQHKELEAANITKNKFFSVLSHDLRSPLATFNSYAEIIDLCIQQKEYDKLEEISRELQSSTDNLLDLLDNLLQWGVHQMGNARQVPTVVNVKDVVMMEVGHLQNISNKKQIAVNVNIPINITLVVDRVSMAITVRNLINNALKFTPSGGTVTVLAYQEKKNTVLKVSDTGVGMTEEQKDKLFQFNDINSTFGTQNEKGIGLGLQLVCGFIKSHHAKIEVESTVGVGTSFIITFPE